MEIFINLLEAAVRLTEGYNPIKYLLSSKYREDFHNQRGDHLILALLAYAIGILTIIGLAAAIGLFIYCWLRYGRP